MPTLKILEAQYDDQRPIETLQRGETFRFINVNDQRLYMRVKGVSPGNDAKVAVVSLNDGILSYTDMGQTVIPQDCTLTINPRVKRT